MSHIPYLCIELIDLHYQTFDSVSYDSAYQSLTEAALTAQ